jgi:hypothetical protein
MPSIPSSKQIEQTNVMYFVCSLCVYDIYRQSAKSTFNFHLRKLDAYAFGLGTNTRPPLRMASSWQDIFGSWQDVFGKRQMYISLWPIF